MHAVSVIVRPERLKKSRGLSRPYDNAQRQQNLHLHHASCHGLQILHSSKRTLTFWNSNLYTFLFFCSSNGWSLDYSTFATILDNLHPILGFCTFCRVWLFTYSLPLSVTGRIEIPLCAIPRSRVINRVCDHFTLWKLFEDVSFCRKTFTCSQAVFYPVVL